MTDLWKSLEKANQSFNDFVEAIRVFFINFDELIGKIAETISEQVESSTREIKWWPPLKLIQRYSFIPYTKKNLPYQRRNY